MKVTRKTLLIITASLGGLLIVYSAFRMIAEKVGWNFKLPEKYEKWLIDGIIFGALAIFMYNRKLARDEKRAKEEAERAALEPAEPIETGDDDRPHWERNSGEETGDDESEEDEEEPEEKPDARR